MPVAAKLSLKLYEKLGDEIANELVEWFNQVDATYRADLRELNELNFARFDAKLEQRVAGLKAALQREMGDLRSTLEGIEGRLTRWIVGFWAGTTFTLLGAMIALLKL